MTMMLSPGQATRRQREAAQAHQAAEAEAEAEAEAAQAHQAAEAGAADVVVEGEAVVEAADPATGTS